MEKTIIIFALISSALSSCISLFYAYIAYKKTKDPPKDEIWETATKILCSGDSMKQGDDFAILYEELKLFKENGCSMKDIDTSYNYEGYHMFKKKNIQNGKRK